MQQVGRAAPPISVGLPVYNGERYLEESIRSVLGQTFTDLELVITDNASDDATESICRAAAARDQRVRYLRATRNRGGAWNFGAVPRVARSPLFAYQSHDDLRDPRFLESCLRSRTERPDAVLWYARAARIDAQGASTGTFADSLELLEDTPHERLRSFFRQHRSANALYGLIDRAALVSARPMATHHSADTVLLADLALRGRFVEVPEVLFLRRVHEEMSHAGRSDEEIERWWDPSSRRTVSMRRTRMFEGFIRVCATAPVDGAERGRCVREVVAYWLPRYGRHMAGEVRRWALLTATGPVRAVSSGRR